MSSIFKNIWKKLNKDVKIISLPDNHYCGSNWVKGDHPWYIYEIAIWFDLTGNIFDDLRKKGKSYPFIFLMVLKPVFIVIVGVLSTISIFLLAAFLFIK